MSSVGKALSMILRYYNVQSILYMRVKSVRLWVHGDSRQHVCGHIVNKMQSGMGQLERL